MNYVEDDGVIYSEPVGLDLAECRRRGSQDFHAGVMPINCPYVAGHPFYAWEEGYEEARSAAERTETAPD